jgi:Raf kinase inhibitor-like YbhB/YbcL family protein
MKTRALMAFLFLAACGGSGDDDGGGDDDGAATPDANTAAPDAEDSPDAAPAFALTSTVITEGGMFPDKYTCEGDNISPPLSWTPAANAQSYAIVFHDTDNDVVHWVMWDIPTSVLSLPETVENAAQPATPAGAKQVRSYDDSTYGYLGPCPGTATHLYQFTIYAIDAATIPDLATTDTNDEAKMIVENHSINGASLRANSD